MQPMQRAFLPTLDGLQQRHMDNSTLTQILTLQMCNLFAIYHELTIHKYVINGN